MDLEQKLAQGATLEVVDVIEAGRFVEGCPICLTAPANTEDHVPQRGLGGEPMTKTCAPCNNNLGSRTEAALDLWFRNEARVAYMQPAGGRAISRGRVRITTGPDGSPQIHGGEVRQPDDLVDYLTQHGSVQMRVIPPSPHETATGLLKNAYLAAVLLIGGVPRTPSFEAARYELLRARDARRGSWTVGPMSASLRVIRVEMDRPGLPLALGRLHGDASAAGFWIVMGGQLLVAWPFEDWDPMVRSTSKPSPSTSG